MRFLAAGIVAVCLTAPFASAQTWNPGKVYYAGPNGQPNALRFIDNNGTNYPGWTVEDSRGIITNQAPTANPAGKDGLQGNFIRITNSTTDGKTGAKEKYRTNKTGTGHDWTFNSALTARTALFWRLYVPSSPTVDRFPSINIRTHGYKHVLDFRPTAAGTCSDGGGPPRSGWVGGDNAEIISGGWPIADGTQYLPMSMDEWHTIRMEVTTVGVGPGGVNGSYFEAWIDEDKGLSDINHIVGFGKDTASDQYIEIGRRSTNNESDNSQFWTNYLAWGQNIQGGANEIAPLPAGGMEYCHNGIDDDGDGLTDCADPACPCLLAAENTEAACSNGKDDDGDGLRDCDDPDCAAQPFCSQDAPEYVVTLIRQVGDWQNAVPEDHSEGIAQIYFSVYDEDGQPLNGVTIADPCNNAVATTSAFQWNAPGQVQYPSAVMLNKTTYSFHVTGDQSGSPVSSEVTPPLILNTGDSHAGFYSWQIEFMRKSHRSKEIITSPLAPAYRFDDVDLNVPPFPNASLTRDKADLSSGTGVTGVLFGQTFTVPQGINRIVSARVELGITKDATYQYQLTVHPVLHNPPLTLATDIGPQIGGTRNSPNVLTNSAFWNYDLTWPISGADSIPVEPGQMYFLKVVRLDSGNGAPGFNVLRTINDYYPGGESYRSTNGTTLTHDQGWLDLVATVVGVGVSACQNDPVFDVTGPTGEPDGYVNQQDFSAFDACATGPTPPESVFEALSAACKCMDVNQDHAVDQSDFGAFQRCYNGDAAPADPRCDN